jgi:hypothetical protein
VKTAATLLVALLFIGGIYCGGGETAETPATPTTETGHEGHDHGAMAAEGFPEEAFQELTKAEMDEYVKVLPEVSKAFKAAGYKSVSTEDKSLMADMAATIEGMKAVPGAEDAVKKAGSTWDKFRVTTFKVMSASAAMAMGMAEAMAESMSDESAEAKAALAEVKKAKEFFAGVPEKNQTMMFEYMEQLEPLSQLDE